MSSHTTPQGCIQDLKLDLPDSTVTNPRPCFLGGCGSVFKVNRMATTHSVLVPVVFACVIILSLLQTLPGRCDHHLPFIREGVGAQRTGILGRLGGRGAFL